VDAEFLFIPLRWVAKSASFAGYFLPLRSDGVLFVMKGSGIWDRDHGAREPAEALTASSSAARGDPSLTAAILALDRIDSAARLHRLLYLRKPGAMACRTFTLDQFRRWLSHSNLSGARLGFQIIGE
jgi:hypothetical protein